MGSEGFELVDLESFESGSVDSSYSFVGLSLGTASEESDHPERNGASGGISVEQFFEHCFDSGVRVYPESKFTKGPFLGSGATMAVYEGTWKETGSPVALKYFKNALSVSGNIAQSSTNEHRRLLEAGMLELRVLSDTRARSHENIVTLQAVSWTLHDGLIYPILITELACKEHPTLASLIKDISLPLDARYELIRDVVEGLLLIHDRKVVYGDMKPENILIFLSQSSTSRLTAKLSDFGFCQATSTSRLEAGGTLYWNAPECLHEAPTDLKEHAYTTSRDIYTLGLLIAYILTGERPFGALGNEGITEMKLKNQVSKLVSSKIGNIMDAPNSGTNLLPQKLLEIVSLTAVVNPRDRPSLRGILEALLPHTQRREPLPEVRHKWRVEGSILATRFSRLASGIGSWSAEPQLDTSTPPELRQQLYEHVLNVASHGGPVDQVKAMDRLGMFFLNAFGTPKSIQNAFMWFCRAADNGSVRGMEMMFRLEKATKDTPMPLVASITTETRAQWTMTCLLGSLTSSYNPRLCPESVDINDINSRVNQVLKSITPTVLLDALQDDIEANIIMLQLQNDKNSIVAEKTLQQIEKLSQGSYHLQCILDAVCDDDEETLDRILQRKEPLPPGFLNLLVTLSADRNRRSALRSLILKHGADPDTIDTHSGRETTSLVDAVLRDDYGMTVILMNCGADTSCLMGRRIMEFVIQRGTPIMMRLFLTHWLSIEIKSDNGNLQDTSSICHQFLDGIYPSATVMYNQTGVPPDSNQLPPLFHAVAFNLLNQLQVLLINGADPNIRFNGISPIHVAVRMLRPTALLLLLEFGANPNSRNSREGYTTPLHALSQDFMCVPPRIFERTNQSVDFLGRRWQTDKHGQGELMQRRSVITHLLLKYGADPAACCIDGFTPLMTSMISPVPDSDSVFALLVQGGITLTDRTTRGETILHIAARIKDVSWLQRIVSIAGPQLINCRDNLLSTPLFLAAQDGDSPGALEILLSNGADVSLRGMLNLSSLDIAVLEGNGGSVDVLLDHITKLPTGERRRLLTARDTWGRTSIHICLASNDFELACNYIRRILRLERYFSYHLLTSHDYFEATPIDYACKVGNEAALRVIAQNIVPKSLGPVRVEILPPWRNHECKPDEDPVLSSFKVYQSLQKVLNEPSHKDIARCYDASEFSLPDKELSAVEEEWESFLRDWQREDGGQSKRVLLCMNYLGTVTERHGRLKKAQGLYYKGWTLARPLLGDQSVVTQDFACKFLRVSQDRGVHETVSADIAKWHKLHGHNTLKPSYFEFCLNPEEVEEIASKFKAHDIQDKASRQCDRLKCGKRANFACPGCSYVHYCSEACRVADMTDQNVQHHLACIRAEPISSSLALKFIPHSPVQSGNRSLAQNLWNRFRKLRPRAPETLPPLRNFFTIALGDEEELTTPVYAPLEQNLLIYWRESAHEVRWVSVHTTCQW
ncbi:serine/threonine protein kinase [Penicillium robsamsonii]|uniref:serine/threonine protein kinase n=1 Tax=Penicillium robsamsonii TaxID=1792511 RepID=UPI002547A24C|nr:serine/threonine protein kinase [Penicillium robsamsonii]KAJ5813167.1 serine/threonine protein kinase [Penicillium robsamsonii]